MNEDECCMWTLIGFFGAISFIVFLLTMTWTFANIREYEKIEMDQCMRDLTYSQCLDPLKHQNTGH